MLQVLKRSGTADERRYAAIIIPLVSNRHLLLVTLLLCNAMALSVGVGADAWCRNDSR